MSGIVTKAVGGVFATETADGKKYVCFSPKKLRFRETELLVGDNVRFEPLSGGKGNITEILPRKNRLKRPEVANIDVCFVVLANVPKPDFYLADKVLVNCFKEKIQPVIIVNKTDLGPQTAEEVRLNYDSVCDILCVSSFDPSSLNCLRDYISGRIACFAGQSAVGKTSILNALLPNFHGEIGGISQKTGRGMHTTRHSNLHKVFGGYIIDTCGFSLCDADGIRSDELKFYYDDFVTSARKCKFASCTHTVEPDCAVKKAVRNGSICQARYNRYLEEYKELLEAEKHKY